MYLTSGVFAVLLQNAEGCDSTAYLNLTIETLDANVTQGGLVLTADDTVGTFQWIDCENGFSPIVGATNP